MAEGATVNECLAVLQDRWNKWQGGDMQQYFTPVTLFRPTKFPIYLEEAKVNGWRRDDRTQAWMDKTWEQRQQRQRSGSKLEEMRRED